MANDTPTLRADVLRVLAGADGRRLGLADIAAELRITTKEDRADLARVLYRLRASGTVTAEPAGEKGRRFRYRIAEGGLHAACKALERSLEAMVKDASVMAAVRAYGALREAIARYKT